MFPFNLLARPRAGAVRRARLAAEGLEARETPTDLAPVITDFTASEAMSGFYLFYGRVVDENPEGLVVTFGGGTSTMPGQTTTADADGWFTLLIQLNTDGTDAGTVTASTVDAANQASNVASVDVAPTIT